MADLSATEVWERVLDDLQIQVTRPTFETWLKQTAGVAVSDDAFVVGAPNAFVAEMLEQRMSSLIAQAVERQVRRRLDVRIEVGGGHANATPSGTATTTLRPSRLTRRTWQPRPRPRAAGARG